MIPGHDTRNPLTPVVNLSVVASLGQRLQHKTPPRDDALPLPRSLTLLLAWLAPESAYPDTDTRRRASVFALISCVIVLVGCVRGLVFTVAGAYPIALMFGVTGLSGLAYASAVRRGWRLDWCAHIFAIQFTLILLTVAVLRGGIGANVLTVNAVLALKMTYVLGARTGVFWWLVSVASVLVLYGVEASGVAVLHDQMTESALSIDAVTGLIIPTAALGVALVFEWSRLRAQEALRVAVQRQATAEKDLMIMKADKMASVGLLAAGVGHEMNNPLTYVRANIDFVRKSLDAGANDRATLVQALTDAETGVRRLAKITTDLSAFAQNDEDAVIESVDLSGVAHSALELTRHELDHRCSVELELQDKVVVSAIESRLVQVVVNLLLNAKDALEGATNGRVSLRTGVDGGHAFLDVSDSGPGIPKKDQERIFDAFFTTKPVGAGQGLGLANSRSLVRAVGGTLTVQSAPGEGATFRVRLPLAVVKRPTSRRERQHPNQPPRYRILIVDDDALVQRAIARMLRPHEVVYCPNGQSGLDTLSRDPAFDLILSDVMMYPMAGWEFLEQVRKRSPEHLPRFAFMTGGAFTPAARAHLRKADVPILEKPFQREAVVELIQKLEE